MSDGYNLRKFTRVEVDTTLTISVPGGPEIDATILEMSPVGLSVEAKHDFKDSERVDCTLFTDKGHMVEFEAKVLWRDKNTTGFMITYCDAASSQNLKEVLMRAAYDPVQVEAEYQINILDLPPQY